MLPDIQPEIGARGGGAGRRGTSRRTDSSRLANISYGEAVCAPPTGWCCCSPDSDTQDTPPEEAVRQCGAVPPVYRRCTAGAANVKLTRSNRSSGSSAGGDRALLPSLCSCAKAAVCLWADCSSTGTTHYTLIMRLTETSSTVFIAFLTRRFMTNYRGGG